MVAFHREVGFYAPAFWRGIAQRVRGKPRMPAGFGDSGRFQEKVANRIFTRRYDAHMHRTLILRGLTVLASGHRRRMIPQHYSNVERAGHLRISPKAASMVTIIGHQTTHRVLRIWVAGVDASRSAS